MERFRLEQDERGHAMAFAGDPLPRAEAATSVPHDATSYARLEYGTQAS